MAGRSDRGFVRFSLCVGHATSSIFRAHEKPVSNDFHLKFDADIHLLV
jgi:hypothetical protein